MHLVAISCPAPVGGNNTVDIPADVADGLLYQEIYTYSCKDGYNTSDELSTVCQPDGTLSLSSPPACAG